MQGVVWHGRNMTLPLLDTATGRLRCSWVVDNANFIVVFVALLESRYIYYDQDIYTIVNIYTIIKIYILSCYIHYNQDIYTIPGNQEIYTIIKVAIP